MSAQSMKVFPLHLELSKKGFNAFAIQYRTGGLKVATEDLSAAINFVFAHADQQQIDTSNYSLWGGSAAARPPLLLLEKMTELLTGKPCSKESIG